MHRYTIYVLNKKRITYEGGCISCMILHIELHYMHFNKIIKIFLLYMDYKYCIIFCISSCHEQFVHKGHCIIVMLRPIPRTTSRTSKSYRCKRDELSPFLMKSGVTPWNLGRNKLDPKHMER